MIILDFFFNLVVQEIWNVTTCWEGKMGEGALPKNEKRKTRENVWGYISTMRGRVQRRGMRIYKEENWV